MSSLLQHTKAELRAAGMFDPDADFDGAVAPCVTALMEAFCAYGHSGGSAPVTLAAFHRLAQHKPLTPLTGEDDEWDDRSAQNGSPLWQNKRCHSVFKNEDGAWQQLEGQSRVIITAWPYKVM